MDFSHEDSCVISYVVPTIGRPSLLATLQSIDCGPKDEILLVGQVSQSMLDAAQNMRSVRFVPCQSGRNWGCKERTIALSFARGQYLSFMDDDDQYMPNVRRLMKQVVKETPKRPVLFRMQYPDGTVLWKEPVLKVGNVGTPMMLIPNDVHKLGYWTPRREGDFDFLNSMQWTPQEIVWRSEIIARIGHNDA